MATRAEILNGADFEGYEDFCADVVNAIKNHYRVSNPCVNMVARQPGEILSDPDDDKLYHVGGVSGYACDEILQATRSCDVIPEFIGIDYYDVCNGDYATIRGIDEPGLGHRLTIGLDETARTMVICDAGDIYVDFGLAAQAAPSLYIFNAAGTAKVRFSVAAIVVDGGYQIDNWGTLVIRQNQDLAAGNQVTFDTAAGAELTDNNAEQAFIYIEPKINQTSTAGYIGLLMDVTETSLGDASAGAGYNALMDLRISATSYFAVQNDGVFRMSDGTDLHLFGSYQEPGLGGRLTIGLDETARILLLCDYGDFYNDFGLIVQANPTLFIYNAGANSRTFLNNFQFSMSNNNFSIFYAFGTSALITSRDRFDFRVTFDRVAGHNYIFGSNAGIELTDTNAEQAWVYIEPKINQTLTAGYVAVLVDVTETSLGDGSAGAGYNALMDLRVAGTTQFGIQNAGAIMTNQTAAATTLGSVTDRLPIYDGTGTLVGYIAIYDSIT